MILNENGLKDKAAWEAKGYMLPAYDRAEMIEKSIPLFLLRYTI